MKPTAFLLICAALAPGLIWGAEPAPELSTVVREVRAEVKADRAMEYMRRVYSTDRFFTFPKFQETAEYLRDTLRGLGMKNVELLGAPADGVSQFGYWTMPLAWDVKKARLEIVEPAVPEQSRVLADYEKIPASLGMWSGPTPAGGVTVEVVELRGSRAEIEKLDLKGKLVLTSRGVTSLKPLLARKGALGAINAGTENPRLQDTHQWVNAWGDSGWAFTKTSTPLVLFSITPRQGELLRSLLARGPVRVHAEVDSRYYNGTYPYATAVLPGTSPEEEVLELGHTSEQGANDNATGIAAMVEAIGTLNRLIESGRLPRPRRSIRILAMGELYPTMHYIATHSAQFRRTVAALCLDTPAATYDDQFGADYAWHMDPDVSRSFVDALSLRVAEAYFSGRRVSIPVRAVRYGTGTDEFLPDPMIGVPTVWPYAGTGLNTHHNSADTPEKVDARALRDLSAVSAVFLYAAASAGEAEIPWLAELVASRAYGQILDANRPLLERAVAAQNASELGRVLEEGKERNQYELVRNEEAVKSVLRLAPEARRSGVEASLAAMLDGLRRFSREQSDRLRETVNRRAAALGIATPVQPVAAPADPQMADASRMIVKRKRFGTLPLDDIPVDQWEGYPSGAWALVPITALYWCDGRRDLAEVIRLTRMEQETGNFNFVGYFRFLARKGYVELMSK